MLRTAAMARAALRSRRRLLWSSSSSSSFPNHHAISKIAFIDHHCPNPRFPFFNSSSRSYARMARRIPPPVRRTPHDSQESESDSEPPEQEANELDFLDEYGAAAAADDDGEESEEWEGFTMDFGSIGKKDDNPDKAEEKEEDSC